jgi:hypothetical protein
MDEISDSPLTYPSQSEPCCDKTTLLHEYLTDTGLQLWASTESGEDLTLWIACRSCGKNSPLAGS